MAKQKVLPHEVRRWRYNVPVKMGVRVGPWKRIQKYQDAPCELVMAFLRRHDKLDRVEVELRNGQRVFVKLLPLKKKRPSFPIKFG